MSFRFAVLNPAGRDRNQIFDRGAGSPEDPGHPPVNYHGYAACMGAGFFRSLDAVPSDASEVLVLLRKKNLRRALEAVQQLKKRGVRCWISLKESGLHQIADFLGNVSRMELFLQIAAAADGYIASTAHAADVYRSVGLKVGAFIPTPYPVGEPGWAFGSNELSQRAGIFVGTREFSVPTRRHAEALLAADALSLELECPVVAVNPDGRWGGMMIHRIRRQNPLFFVAEGPLDYPMYLGLMASHRIVLQLDRSRVPGQVAGDALLAGIPSVGGDGAIDQIVFADLAGGTIEETMNRARRLLTDDTHHAAVMEQATKLGTAMISFEAGRRALVQLFERDGLPT